MPRQQHSNLAEFWIEMALRLLADTRYSSYFNVMLDADDDDVHNVVT